MKDQTISKHISYHEATYSPTAVSKGIPNHPPPDVLERMRVLAAKVFEPLREIIGHPVGISSFYRSRLLNMAVKGSPTSQHTTGEAIDLDGDKTGVSNAEIFTAIRDNLEFDQLIWEFGTDEVPDWVHVSYRTGANRNQVLRSVRQDGHVSYKQM